MAYCGIAVVLGSKVISSIAIFLKEGDIRRAALQFIDLLIFEEIYESHKKIISQIKNKKSIKAKQTAIESTLSFKYVRNFEAVFESIPQSVLQLVFIMRVPDIIIDPIFIVSIIQSVVSMTNSILNNDYTHMQEDKWKRHKQRLPPTWECFKHALSRLSEVAYRIGLLSLFWCVCGGVPFCIMMGFDVLMISGRMIGDILTDEAELNGDTVLLAINSFIVIPSEMVYSGAEIKSYWWCIGCGSGIRQCIAIVLVNLCCCLGLVSFLTSIGPMIYMQRTNAIKVYFAPSIRIGTSLMELMFLIFYGIFAENGAREKFLVDPDHGLYIFIATCISLFIYMQYLLLFPNFALPLGVNVRSKWGYAFGNELSELKKVKVKLRGKLSTPAEFWDQTHGLPNASAAVFAVAKEHYDIVEWLEQQGAVVHKEIDVTTARKLLELEKEEAKDLKDPKDIEEEEEVVAHQRAKGKDG
eukprot:679430_1